jgi:chromosome segregation ATPase
MLSVLSATTVQSAAIAKLAEASVYVRYVQHINRVEDVTESRETASEFMTSRDTRRRTTIHSMCREILSVY